MECVFIVSILLLSVVERHIWLIIFCGWEAYVKEYFLLISFLMGFQRVKVYRLNEDGKWDDQGTGHVTIDYLEVCKSFSCTFICDIMTWLISLRWNPPNSDAIWFMWYTTLFLVEAFICDWHDYFMYLLDFPLWSVFFQGIIHSVW